MANDYYKTLGVGSSATQDEIAKAYRKLARKHHPDLNPDDQNAKKRFQEIQTAYDTLNDPEKRKKYDQYGEAYERMGAGGAPFGGGGWSSGQGGFDFGDIFGGSGGASAVDLGDIFRQFGGGGGGRSRRAQVPKGHDIAAELELPLRTLLQGGETQFQLQRDGKMESIRVKVPAGIEPGKKIRLRGQGGGMPGGKPGDLLLTIRLEPHPNVKLVGSNIEMKVPISLAEAVGGARIDVPTAKGTATITIPPMSSSGKRLRLKGQGFPAAGGTHGDLMIELQIKLPDSMSESTQAAIDSLSTSYPSNFRDSIQW